MGTTDALLRSWRRAESDLGIQVEGIGAAVLVLDFGSPAGVLCVARVTPEMEQELRRQSQMRGAGFSVLSDAYLTYDRQSFVDALNDWGWFGDAAPPAWYSGAPWTT